MDDFNRLLGRLRLRLGCERLVQFGIHGTLASGLALVALSSATWLTGSRDPLLWAAAAPLIVALAFAALSWPSAQAAALAADRRLNLDERLATAVDLTRRQRRGRFDSLQMADAFARGSNAPVAWLALDVRARNEALLALGVAVLGIASVTWLPGIPGPTQLLSTDASDRGLAPSEMVYRTVPDTQATAAPFVTTQPTSVAPTSRALASQVQQELAERAALDSLARALGSVSAGQPAADAMQQGDFSAARDQLQSLADQTDQLSQAAKQQLARALQQAAGATAASDKQMSDREHLAAQALTRSSYSEQRQALRSLADQLSRSSARSVPSDQLQRDLGRLQQQQVGSSSSQTGSPATSSGSNQPASTGAGIGSGSDQSTSTDASQLATTGQEVQVPSRLGSGPGVRPPNGTEDQVGSSPSLGNRDVSELSRAQQTGQVAPEANVVPSEQRPVIRGYFR